MEEANIKVFCRFRPLNNKELQFSQNYCVSFLDDMTVKARNSETFDSAKFVFDRVFPPSESQENVYLYAAKPIVDAVMQGFNGTVFAYGQTSSGKTFTMTGPDLEDVEYAGIIPRMINTVFDCIAEADDHVEFSVKVAYCEIYMEKIKDLLEVHKNNLKVHEDRTRGVYIEGLTEQYVCSDREVYEIMKIGSENREVAYTNMNSNSSRSHSLFILTVSQTNSKDLSGKIGKLYLVDLAGSEKVAKTGAAGKRLEEAKTINKSLTTLGLVINSLTDGKSTHIPYRDSKLTRVLQDSLGGNSKTSLIITCSPSAYNEAETISTLRFGVRAKNIKNKPKVNREYTLAELKLMISKAQEEIEKKDKIIERLENNLKTYGAEIPKIEETESHENKRIEFDEILAEIDELRLRLADEVDNNKGIVQEIEKIQIDKQHITEDYKSVLERLNEVQEKFLVTEKTLGEQEALIEKLMITKETLEADNQQILRLKQNMEELINEKDLEIRELKLKSPISPKRNSESIIDLKSQLEFEKDKNKDLLQKCREMEKNLMETTKLLKENNNNIQDILIQQAVEREKMKWDEERKSILKDLTDRINKVIELQIALENSKENYEILENSLTLGERKLKIKCDLLTKNLEQVTDAHNALLSEKSNFRVEIKIFEKKVSTLTEKNYLLQEELNKYKVLLDSAEAKIRSIEEEIFYGNSSRHSINNSSRRGKNIVYPNVKKLIKGGKDTSRLSYVLE